MGRGRKVNVEVNEPSEVAWSRRMMQCFEFYGFCSRMTAHAGVGRLCLTVSCDARALPKIPTHAKIGCCHAIV